MARILISAGPIPARIDSVKYITNRFRGGLALRTAATLKALYRHEVILVKWKYSHFGNTTFEDECDRVISVEDVNDYMNKVLAVDADVYVLAAAVANLQPTNPWKGKFPSHDYKVGDKFNIEFEIAPRIIDEIKKKRPRVSLVGYKLFDGNDDELKEAAWETLMSSKSNIVFANHPAWAKTKKIMMTLDGAEIECSFDTHVAMIDKLARSKFYKTNIVEMPLEQGKSLDWLWKSDVLYKILSIYPKYKKRGFTFGCFAWKFGDGDSFVTTTRGKRDADTSVVLSVDHDKRVIDADRKATLNAPLLDMIFKKNPDIKFLVHGHREPADCYRFNYELPGTDREVSLASDSGKGFVCYYIDGHGYVAGFKSLDECVQWCKDDIVAIMNGLPPMSEEEQRQFNMLKRLQAKAVLGGR